MKLYHIDRACLLQEGQILQLQKDFYIGDKSLQKCIDLTNDYFKDGLSSHGITYFMNGQSNEVSMSISNAIEIVLEYERQLYYKEKLSRYKAFFAFDKEGVKKFIQMKNLNSQFYKIYEVESDYYEKHNMNLLSGGSHFVISALAKCYWEDKNDPFEREEVSEYLLRYPITIGKEVKLEDIK